MLVALGLVAWATKGLQILNVKSQLWEKLPWLDVVEVDGEHPTVLSPALTTHQAVSRPCLLAQLAPLH